MGRFPFDLRRASLENVETVHWLREDARKRLRHLNTDQWQSKWPDPDTHDRQIRQDLTDGKTWVAWDGAVPAATITIDTDDPLDAVGRPVWPARLRREQALYIRRVIVSRRNASQGLGVGLLHWAAEGARSWLGTPLIRVNVWTDNRRLHQYYLRQGFRECPCRGARDLPGYPARALFERRAILGDYTSMFKERELTGPRHSSA